MCSLFILNPPGGCKVKKNDLKLHCKNLKCYKALKNIAGLNFEFKYVERELIRFAMISSDSYLLTQSVISFLLATPAVLSNVLLLVSIYRRRSPGNRNQLSLKPVTLLVVNLSVCDLLSAIVPGYVSCAYGFYRIHIRSKIRAVELLIIIVAVVTNIVSSCTISAMSFNCWLGVSSPFQHRARLTKAKIKVFIALVWFYSLLFVSLFGAGVSKAVFVLLYCHIHVSLPLIILPVVYCKTYAALRLQGNQVVNLADGRQRMAFAHRNRQRKLLSAFLLILVLFYVSFTPHFIANNIFAIRPSLSETGGFKFLQYVSNTFTLVNSSVNPYIYSWRIPEYREAFKAVFRGSVCRIKRRIGMTSDRVNIASGHLGQRCYFINVHGTQFTSRLTAVSH